MRSRKAFWQLFVCGAACLFWELLLIRWMGSCIRVVSYFSNFILIAAFFGLGAGALMSRFSWSLRRILVPILCLVIFLGPVLGSFFHLNPTSTEEFLWLGAPPGVTPGPAASIFSFLSGMQLPYWLILAAVYLAIAFIFMIFGQWLGNLFKEFRPLTAYTIEIGGSIAGILLFALISAFQLPPPVWFSVGFIMILPILAATRKMGWFNIACVLVVLVAVFPFSNQFIWSRYYKVHVFPMTSLVDLDRLQSVEFRHPIGYHITVNNDYHQMILDLHDRQAEHPFFSSWRTVYEYPYTDGHATVEGPILIVGAGTGNDVSAALRRSTARIDAVEIDARLIELGRQLHPEQPYANPKVHVVVDDARSYFATTDTRYAKVIFGFLDSHTLTSSFASVRLESFVYTRESLERVRQLLLPGGRVYITFASNKVWLHERLVRLMDSVYDFPTTVIENREDVYTNGIIYVNRVKADDSDIESMARFIDDDTNRIPTDDWPFLYMKTPTLPGHYRVFIAVVIGMGLAAMSLLPRGQRRLKFLYFFMGAGFFLIETSNVISLSLLFGSTWQVNTAVFTGILLLILFGNLTSSVTRPRYVLLFSLLFGAVLIAYATPKALFLNIESTTMQIALATVVFLGPIYFASLIFAHLIKREEQLYEAYGSNLLGAILGGATEYLSLIYGLNMLLLITLGMYIIAATFLWRGRAQ